MQARNTFFSYFRRIRRIDTELPKVGSKLFFDRFVVSFERGVCGKICSFGGFMDFWQWHQQAHGRKKLREKNEKCLRFSVLNVY